MTKRNIIVVTDGDKSACKAVETAAANIGARCISLSSGNPTWVTGPAMVKLIKETPHDPVVVMVDDRGVSGMGKGESVLAYIAGHPEINILGVLAVASNTAGATGANVDCSVNREGKLTCFAVDKTGNEKLDASSQLVGDTVDILNQLDLPVIVGIGDIGKMDGLDDYRNGAPLTTKALLEIIERSGFIGTGSGRE